MHHGPLNFATQSSNTLYTTFTIRREMCKSELPSKRRLRTPKTEDAQLNFHEPTKVHDITYKNRRIRDVQVSSMSVISRLRTQSSNKFWFLVSELFLRGFWAFIYNIRQWMYITYEWLHYYQAFIVSEWHIRPLSDSVCNLDRITGKKWKDVVHVTRSFGLNASVTCM